MENLLGYYDNVFFNLNDNGMSMIFMQTPKEKAHQLVKEFFIITTTSIKAKECAKLHIRLVLENEILKPSNNLVIKYYHRVEEEIEKL